MLDDFIGSHRRLFVLTGAGVSAASGIPTYRDRDARWQRNAPITHQEFTSSEHARKRYWARSLAGWPLMGRAQPNAAHRALAALQQAGRVALVTTQNVDGLHQRAGSADVIELHGNVGDVRCLDCGTRAGRASLQPALAAANPRHADRAARIAPDGDADLAADTDDFVVPGCIACGGILKPDVVFFGDSVPRERVERAYAALDASDAMLVVGSSLMVYSGFRFCEHAAARGVPIAAVNQGRTRADDLFALKIDADCVDALPAAVASVIGADEMSSAARERVTGQRDVNGANTNALVSTRRATA